MMTPGTIAIHDGTARMITPEGECFAMPLAELMACLQPKSPDPAGIPPKVVRRVFQRGTATVWVVECPAAVRTLDWIAAGSPKQFGPGTTYRRVRLSLPYTLVFVGFEGPVLSKINEAYFRNEPLASVDDAVCYPTLLNCSKVQRAFGFKSWLCTQHLPRGEIDAQPTPREKMLRGLRLVLECLWCGGFNYSSEHHEGASWFTESRGVDPRLNTVEEWEAATAEDPGFIRQVKFLPTGWSVQDVAERMLTELSACGNGSPSQSDLARIIQNHGHRVPLEELVP